MLNKIRLYLSLGPLRNLNRTNELTALYRLRLYKSTTFVTILVYVSVIVQTRHLYWENPLFYWMFNFLFVSIFFNYLLVNFHRNAQFAFRYSIFIFYFLLHIATYITGGIKNPGGAYLLCLVLYTYILCGKKAGLLLVAASIFHFVYFYLVTQNTTWIDNTYNNNDDTLINLDYLITFMVSIFIIWRQSGFLEKAHKEIAANVTASSSELAAKELEQMELKQAVTESELMALRAQMNPHFIFNCVNSIQNFIFKNNIEAANDYLTGFSRLIRQTLDISAQKSISIAEEISYLNSYLQLEQMRFTGKFTYQFFVSPEIQQDSVLIPNMLLQPFVENSIRHGIRYRKDKAGLISINIDQTDKAVIFSLEDNGIGRKEAELLKSSSHIEYQSKGMTLTRDRVAAINKSFKENITIKIIDLFNDAGEGSGTKVEISFPLTLINKLN